MLRFDIKPLVFIQYMFRRVCFEISRCRVLLLGNVPLLSHTLVIFQILVFENGLNIELVLLVIKYYLRPYFRLGLMFENRNHCFARANRFS